MTRSHAFMLIQVISVILAVTTLAGASHASSLIPEKVTSWGVYQIHRGAARFEDGLKAQIEQLGATPEHVLFFRDLHPRRGFPTAAAEVCKRYGAIPVISKELWQWSERHAERSDWLGRINSGQTDAYWREWAEAAKSFEADVILRFGFEMNGDWFGWGQQPKAFIAAWRRVHSIIREEVGAYNVQFMFSPNIEWDASRELTAIELYYPGDAFVELLGLDGYNFGDSHSEWHRWQTYDEVFGKSIEKMSQWKQPLILAEIGSADGPRKAEWMQDFLESVKSDTRVAGFIYFNHFDPRKGEPNWLLNSDPATLEIFRRTIANNRE